MAKFEKSPFVRSKGSPLIIFKLASEGWETTFEAAICNSRECTLFFLGDAVFAPNDFS